MEGEELTFNYNVDRYGYVPSRPITLYWLHTKYQLWSYRYDAQICYCGEPVCSGFIGGKTQTDLGAMDELYLDGECCL